VRLREAFAPERALRRRNGCGRAAGGLGIDRTIAALVAPMQSLHRVKRDPLQSAVATDAFIGAIGALSVQCAGAFRRTGAWCW